MVRTRNGKTIAEFVSDVDGQRWDIAREPTNEFWDKNSFGLTDIVLVTQNGHEYICDVDGFFKDIGSPRGGSGGGGGDAPPVVNNNIVVGSGGGIRDSGVPIDSKLDKVESGDKTHVYAVDASNEQTMITVVSNTASPETIPERNAAGGFAVGDPVNDSDVVNKKYVDDNAGGETNKVDVANPATESISGTASTQADVNAGLVDNANTQQNKLDGIENDVGDLTADMLTRIGLPAWDASTHDLVFIAKDGTTLTVDLSDLINIDIQFDETTNELIIVDSEGVEHRVDMSALIPVYDGSIGDNVQIAITDNVIEAILRNGTIDASKLTSALQSEINKISGLETAINNETLAREQAINDKQGQIDTLNTQLQETNSDLSITNNNLSNLNTDVVAISDNLNNTNQILFGKYRNLGYWSEINPVSVGRNPMVGMIWINQAPPPLGNSITSANIMVWPDMIDPVWIPATEDIYFAENDVIRVYDNNEWAFWNFSSGTWNEGLSDIQSGFISVTQNNLANKEVKLTSGNNITINRDNPLSPVISATGGIEEAPDDGKQYARQNKMWSEIEMPEGNFVATPNNSVPLLNYVTDATLPMENGEMRFVNDPHMTPTPKPVMYEGMYLIPNPITNKVLIAENHGQAIESDISIDELSLKSDGYLFRISQTGLNYTVQPGQTRSLLQGFAFPTNIERMANTAADEWQITPQGALVFKSLDGYVALSIDVRLSGTIAGVGPGSLGEFSVAMWRPVAGVDTIAAEIGAINAGTLTSKSISFSTYTHQITDPFITDGVRFVLNNTSSSAITVTGVTVLVKGVQH